jgi:hypothetical protein
LPRIRSSGYSGSACPTQNSSPASGSRLRILRKRLPNAKLLSSFGF